MATNYAYPDYIELQTEQQIRNLNKNRGVDITVVKEGLLQIPVWNDQEKSVPCTEVSVQCQYSIDNWSFIGVKNTSDNAGFLFDNTFKNIIPNNFFSDSATVCDNPNCTVNSKWLMLLTDTENNDYYWAHADCVPIITNNKLSGKVCYNIAKLLYEFQQTRNGVFAPQIIATIANSRELSPDEIERIVAPIDAVSAKKEMKDNRTGLERKTDVYMIPETPIDYPMQDVLKKGYSYVFFDPNANPEYEYANEQNNRRGSGANFAIAYLQGELNNLKEPTDDEMASVKQYLDDLNDDQSIDDLPTLARNYAQAALRVWKQPWLRLVTNFTMVVSIFYTYKTFTQGHQNTSYFGVNDIGGIVPKDTTHNSKAIQQEIRHNTLTNKYGGYLGDEIEIKVYCFFTDNGKTRSPNDESGTHSRVPGDMNLYKWNVRGALTKDLRFYSKNQSFVDPPTSTYVVYLPRNVTLERGYTVTGTIFYVTELNGYKQTHITDCTVLDEHGNEISCAYAKPQTEETVKEIVDTPKNAQEDSSTNNPENADITNDTNNSTTTTKTSTSSDGSVENSQHNNLSIQTDSEKVAKIGDRLRQRARKNQTNK